MNGDIDILASYIRLMRETGCVVLEHNGTKIVLGDLPEPQVNIEQKEGVSYEEYSEHNLFGDD